jgi:superfamily II DNA or RNA helicase
MESKNFLGNNKILKIAQVDPLTLQILTKDREDINKVKEGLTAYVEGFEFMPAGKGGNWDGKTSMISTNGSFPYGILFDIIKVHKKHFSNIPIKLSKTTKSIFTGPEIDIEYNLSLKPRPYQKDCIESALKHTKGIIRSSTASGKSLVIAYIISNLFSNKILGKSNKALIVVPSKGLIKQFHNDLVEYGIDDKKIGEVYSNRKQWDKNIVISTWQSLSRNRKKLNEFGCIIVDEVHGAKSYELKKCLQKATTAKYRLGFTGTMHVSDLDNWNTKAYLGPIIREYPSGLLAEEGWISKCNVQMINIEYQKQMWKGTYNDVKDEVFNRPYRMKFIEKLVKELDHNVLLLVGKVEDEGDVLKAWLKDDCGKTVEFLSGKDKVEVREEWRKRCMKEKNIALIATYGIYQQGVNIPNLKYVILVSPFKSKIRVLQSIGRSLRKHADKENGAYIFDLCDQTKYFKKHSDIRLRYYNAEKFNITEYVLIEGDDIDISSLFSL